MTVIHGDCLDVMASIPDHSIDLILADLPYGQGSTGLGWDKIIDPIKLWEQYERLIKPRGAILLTATMPFGAALIMQKPNWFKHDLIWKKSQSNSPGLAKLRPMPVHEHILVFSPKKIKTTYNPQMRKGFKPWKKVNANAEGRKACRSVKYGFKEKPLKYGNEEGRYPISVLEFTNVNYPKHPTQKPVELFEWLIKTYSNPGETVLDNAAGSGTTGVAAINTGRNFILIEKEPQYVAIARQRIEEAARFYEIAQERLAKIQAQQLELAI